VQQVGFRWSLDFYFFRLKREKGVLNLFKALTPFERNITLLEIIYLLTILVFIIPETFFKVKGEDTTITVIARKDVDLVIFILLLDLLKSLFIKHRKLR
jgi:hypothetical protein